MSGLPPTLLPDLGWRELLQLVLVAGVLYRVRGVVRGGRALRVLAAVGAFTAAYGAAWLLHLSLITWLMGLALEYGIIALIVVFAPELRTALAQLGQARFARLFHQMEPREVAEEIVEAVERLSRSGIGAIVVIECDIPLGPYLESGSLMEATVSADLLATIFTPYSPLHDGAVVIRGDVIVAAGVILPLTQRAVADRTLGTRHRAALGLADETDALVLVVSEERSTVSIAERGRLWRDLTTAEVRDLLAGRAPGRIAPEITGAVS